MITENFPHISRTVKADKTVEVTGDVYVGDNCRLEPHVKLESTGPRLIIGNNTVIGESSKISTGSERTILGTDLIIGKNCNIAGSIGHGTKVGDNVVITSSVKIGRNCIINSDQTLENIEIPDDKTVVDGKIQ